MIYCGDKCNAWDHLWPIVVDRRPTGHISEIANLVPACQPCNSSKGNSHWKKWMLATLAVAEIVATYQRSTSVCCLEAYEHCERPSELILRRLSDQKAYAAYWKELDRVIVELEQSQTMGEALRQTIANASSRWQPGRPTIERSGSRYSQSNTL